MKTSMSIKLKDEPLSKNVRVITEHNALARSTSVGIWVNTGSRDEEKNQLGCSHFLEHLLFKGTKTRTSREISSMIENRGGHLNAFTDRDLTAYYARVLNRDQDIATELLCDMLQNSLLKKEDIAMERQVILEEIKQMWDDPSSLIHELYAQNIWRGNPIAHPISGTIETISQMPIETIHEYYEENYSCDLIIVGAGAVDHESLVSSLDNFLQKGRGNCAKDRRSPEHFPGQKYIPRNTGQVQLCISTPGNEYGSKDSAAQSIISSYLGLGASSLLFQEAREKRGLVYNIYTQNQSFADIGAFNVFAGTRKKNLGELVEIIFRELKSMKKGLDQDTLEKVKHKTIGLYTLSSESNRQRMHHLGVSTLRRGKPRTVDDIISLLESVTNEDICRVANNLFKADKIAITTLGMSEKESENIRDYLA
ncbi:hypothetical protein GF326_08325 [Candidatus Bathyarchaeota archaeon]|nr:hypothetical protein [Candidatus Bathyarchaeota archaeon]